MRCYNAGRPTTNEQLKIELLSQWKLEAEFRNQGSPFSFWLLSRTEAGLSQTVKDYKTTLLPSLLIMILIKMTRSTCPMLKRASALAIIACVVAEEYQECSYYGSPTFYVAAFDFSFTVHIVSPWY